MPRNRVVHHPKEPKVVTRSDITSPLGGSARRDFDLYGLSEPVCFCPAIPLPMWFRLTGSPSVSTLSRVFLRIVQKGLAEKLFNDLVQQCRLEGIIDGSHTANEGSDRSV